MDSWIPVLQALATPAIALAGAFIAFAQWRNSRRQAAFALFEKRIGVFNDVESAVREVFSTAKVSQEGFFAFQAARLRARFIFGDDVQTYLEARSKDFAWLMTFTNDVIDADGDRTARIDEKYAAIKRIIAFQDAATPVFARYMRMDQKLPTFLSWL